MRLAILGLLCQASGAQSTKLDPRRLDLLTTEIQAAVDRGEIPGAVCLVGIGGEIIYQRAFGARAVEPEREPMTLDTVFDLASLTKPVVTATCAVSLIQDGTLRLDDKVVKWIPGFTSGGGERDGITVEMLLTHRAGFVPDDPIDLYTGTPAEIFARKYERNLVNHPGEKFVYSDVGFEVLGQVLEAASKKSLDTLAQDRVFVPFGMAEAHFRPVGKESRIPVARIAPTERYGDAFLRGVVHDPRARALGGVAGHAGLFATCQDLARYCTGLLTAQRSLTAATIEMMRAPRFYGDVNIRCLGWDVSTPYSGPRGDLFPRGSFGHTGFTGTSMWLDPSSGVFVILLTNALHPNGKGKVVALRARVATIAAAALDNWDRAAWQKLDDSLAGLLAAAAPTSSASKVSGSGRVLSGAETLRQTKFVAIANKAVGLVTNSTGRLRDGTSTIELLTSSDAKKAGVKLVALFSPEHGIRGDKDEKVENSTDPKSGLPVHSLYGETRRPLQRDLTDLQALVLDLQDVGCRFYTYLATLGYCLEECAIAGIDIVVLDRPNPIGADVFEGPLLDVEKSSFIGYHPIPIRTGLTIGEAARLFNDERKIGARLTVVPMQQYSRDQWYDETGLPWVNPSPNLRSMTQATLYPALCLLEFTNVSVGRGTETPFEIFGAPWLDGVKVADRLTRQAIGGARFTAIRFTPEASQFAGQECGGVRVTITDRKKLSTTRLGFAIATLLRDQFADEWDSERFPELLGDDAIVAKFRAGASVADLERSWQVDLDGYAKRRVKVLLYADPPKK